MKAAEKGTGLDKGLRWAGGASGLKEVGSGAIAGFIIMLNGDLSLTIVQGMFLLT